MMIRNFELFWIFYNISNFFIRLYNFYGDKEFSYI